jgi:TatD DNase family protein
MLFPLYGRRNGVRLALGLHPLEVAKVDLARELSLFQSYAAHTSYIGEVGLDHSREGKATNALQEKALEAILTTPGVKDKIMSVHSRGAAGTTIKRLQNAKATGVILHWFSGSVVQLDAALDAGFYLSVNPAMTRSKKGRAIIARIPPDRALVESDGPYARIARRQLEPTDVLIAIAHLSNLWERCSTDVAHQLEANLRHLSNGLPNARAT